MPASVPLRVRLLGSDGEVLQEEFLAAGPAGAAGRLTLPLNYRGTRGTLEVTELFSGLTARSTLMIQPARGMASLTADRPESAKSASAVVASMIDERLRSWQPTEERFGPHVRDLAVTGDGQQIVLSAFNWDTNLFGLDAATGEVTYRERLGQYFSFNPRPLGRGAAVQGFDFTAGEGYHLYPIGQDGRPERRFALYGLPQRLPHRFVPGLLQDRINNFAVAPDGSWVAAAGDLGLVIWSRDGRLLWKQDWWKRQRHTAHLSALDKQGLLVVEGLKATAYAPADGKVLWEQTLARPGEVQRVGAGPDGRTVVLAATTDGGRIYVLRDGKPHASIPAATDDMSLSPDGQHLAVISGTQLKLYAIGGGLRWVFPGEDTLHSPRFAPDGQRIALASELGTAYVVSLDGRVLLQQDLGSLPVSAWTPEGDLILATWMGTVQRLGRDLAAKWTTRLLPAPLDLRGQALVKDTTATARVTGWGNAEPEGTPVPPNLLGAKNVLLEFKATQPHFNFARPSVALVDGKFDAPAEPWLPWSTVSWFAEGASFNAIQLDTFHKRLRVRGITFWEDPAHPESWLRDAQLEAWDAAAERWLPVMPLLSNQAVHTHRLPKPFEASRWRIVCHRHLVGNLRLAELALHGEEAGPSHPDVIARRPIAVLFDEGDELKAANMVGSFGLSFAFADAYSGGRCLRLEANQSVASPWRQPFGHVLPTWDFAIAEQPEPGQYRYLEFAARAMAPETTGWTLRLDGEGYGNAISCYAGIYQKEEDARAYKVAEAPVQEWRVYRLDLWKLFKKPIRVRGLRLSTRGGPAAFDQVMLRREEAAPAAAKNKPPDK